MLGVTVDCPANYSCTLQPPPNTGFDLTLAIGVAVIGLVLISVGVMVLIYMLEEQRLKAGKIARQDIDAHERWHKVQGI